jgi:hypothetical protein
MDSTLHTEVGGQLNGTYAHKDLLIMEDHPKLVEKVKDVKIESRPVHVTIGATQDQTQTVR